MMKRAVRAALYKLGYELSRIPADGPPTPGYSDVRPLANYSPWLEDREFLRVYNLIKPNTLVDSYRCWELWKLAHQVSDFGMFLEVGVWKGGTGCLLALVGQTILCDTFCGVVKAGRYDTHYKGGEHSDATEQEVRDLARKLGVADRITILRGIFPEETGQLVNDPIALCHIDVDVYESARDVLEKVWPLIIPCGIVVFDDYGFRGCEGVTRLVNELCQSKDRLFVHNLNGHAIFVKKF
jgi:O-methyltransferase